MTKKELTLLRVTGLTAAVNLKYLNEIGKKDLIEQGESCGILRTVYLLSPNEYVQINEFVTSHFHSKYVIHDGDFLKIVGDLQEDYFKEYKL